MDAGALPRLDYTRRLADEVVRDLPPGEILRAVDFEASRETAMSGRLADYRTIVFATHGVLDAEHPALSGIVLSMVDERGQPRDGLLLLPDVYQLELNADLVVLGACQTALGKEVQGEGLIGLSRGFLSAGARRVLGSLWKVDEEATVALLMELHRSARKNGGNQARALREAQLRVRRDPRWRSPYYWAGFTLQGEWN